MKPPRSARLRYTESLSGDLRVRTFSLAIAIACFLSYTYSYRMRTLLLNGKKKQKEVSCVKLCFLERLCQPYQNAVSKLYVFEFSFFYFRSISLGIQKLAPLLCVPRYFVSYIRISSQLNNNKKIPAVFSKYQCYQVSSG